MVPWRGASVTFFHSVTGYKTTHLCVYRKSGMVASVLGGEVKPLR